MASLYLFQRVSFRQTFSRGWNSNFRCLPFDGNGLRHPGIAHDTRASSPSITRFRYHDIQKDRPYIPELIIATTL